jgi:hypothetical protein
MLSLDDFIVQYEAKHGFTPSTAEKRAHKRMLAANMVHWIVADRKLYRFLPVVHNPTRQRDEVRG